MPNTVLLIKDQRACQRCQRRETLYCNTNKIPIKDQKAMYVRGVKSGVCGFYTTLHTGYSGLSLTLVYSSTNMSKSVWTSGCWKPLIHKNMSNFWNNIFHKLGLRFAHVRVLHMLNVWTSELWCG